MNSASQKQITATCGTHGHFWGPANVCIFCKEPKPADAARDNRVVRIEIAFPVPVELPPGFEQMLDSLVGMICKAYERDHPDRTMWPAGFGDKPIWREPEEPDFDNSTYFIEVSEREASQRELERRRRS